MRTGWWQVAVAAVLVGLLGVLGTLQYRWLGEVSDAESVRLRSSLQSRGAAFAAAVDRDITRTFAAFQIDPVAFDADAGRALADALAQARRDSASGAAIRDVFVADPGSGGRPTRLDMSSSQLQPADWPPELSSVRDRLMKAPLVGAAGVPLPPGFAGDAIDAAAPALVVPLTTAPFPQPEKLVLEEVNSPRQFRWRAIVVLLDAAILRDQMVAPTAERELGSSGDFNVTVVRAADHMAVYRAGDAEVRPASADLSLPLFALKVDELRWDRVLPGPKASHAPNQSDRVAVTIVRRTIADPAVAPDKTSDEGSWRVLVQARTGSLDAVVAQSRRRNMAISLGTLGLLGASVMLMAVGAARERRLARQQMEFVASVSHELRTPLAVVRSAGENLADGVVSGPQVAQYGDLIRTEGRRLSAMVERVMNLAGLAGDGGVHTRQLLAVSQAVNAAVAALAHEAAERDITARVTGDMSAAIRGDADALGSALRNVLGNAIKYSPPGSEVDVEVLGGAGTVRIAVRDRGLGIDADDVPHVFEAFYRGRRAVEAQVRGSGIGLSIVRRVVDAHAGRVTIVPRQGGGTEVVITLPAALQGAAVRA